MIVTTETLHDKLFVSALISLSIEFYSEYKANENI